MSRIVLVVLCMALAAPAGAQEAAGWGNELGSPRHPLSVEPFDPDTVHWPSAPLVRPPTPVRAVYVNAWAFGSQRFLRLLDLVEGTEVNSLVIDVKDDTGYLTYRSQVPTAREIGANTQLRAPDTRRRLALAQARGQHVIARIVVAKDPLLAARKPAWAIRHRDGGLWRDRANHAWVDAYQDSVWIYAAQLAEEAVALGFAEIQYDYVRFPDEPPSRRATAVFGARRDGESARKAVNDGLAILRDRTRALGVPFTIDIFGLTTTATGDLGIGQVWEDLVQTADAVLPMVYPSHYNRGEYGFAHPNSEPYGVIRRALKDARARSERLGGQTAEIRPYLQAFTLGAPRYGPEHVRAQIRAAEDLGVTSWVLWNPRSVYERGQLVAGNRGVQVAAAPPGDGMQAAPQGSRTE
jgi:hypothetical protein